MPLLLPIAFLAFIALGGPWRWGYAFVALAQGLLAAVFLFTRGAWDVAGTGPAPESNHPQAAAGYRETLSQGKVWLGILAGLAVLGLAFAPIYPAMVAIASMARRP